MDAATPASPAPHPVPSTQYGAEAPPTARRKLTPFTDAAKATFLHYLSAGARVEDICNSLGVSTSTVYYRRRIDPQFADAWALAVDIRRMTVLDNLAETARTGPADAMSTVQSAEAVLRATDPMFSANRRTPRKPIPENRKPTIRVTIGQPMPD